MEMLHKLQADKEKESNQTTNDSSDVAINITGTTYETKLGVVL